MSQSKSSLIEIKLKEKLKENTQESLENTTLHAIPNIVRSKEIILKIFWLILLLAFLGFFIYCNASSFIFLQEIN